MKFAAVFFCLCLALLFPAMPAFSKGELSLEEQFDKADQEGIAANSLRYLYSIGMGTVRNAGTFKKCGAAARQGNADAQLCAGFFYSQGLGIKRDDAQAAKWLRAAAEQGNTLAYFNLSALYAAGRGVQQDYVEAYFWQMAFSESCERPFSMGTRHEPDNKSHLTPQQVAAVEKRVEEWYRKLAEQDDAAAQCSLAMMYIPYYRPPGRKQDWVEAVQWLRKAAAQGYRDAQMQLGSLYEDGGNGIQQDKKESAFWEALTFDSQGFYEKANATLPGLTPDDIADIRKRLEAWKPVPVARPFIKTEDFEKMVAAEKKKVAPKVDAYLSEKNFDCSKKGMKFEECILGAALDGMSRAKIDTLAKWDVLEELSPVVASFGTDAQKQALKGVYDRVPDSVRAEDLARKQQREQENFFIRYGKLASQLEKDIPQKSLEAIITGFKAAMTEVQNDKGNQELVVVTPLADLVIGELLDLGRLDDAVAFLKATQGDDAANKKLWGARCISMTMGDGSFINLVDALLSRDKWHEALDLIKSVDKNSHYWLGTCGTYGGQRADFDVKLATYARESGKPELLKEYHDNCINWNNDADLREAMSAGCYSKYPELLDVPKFGHFIETDYDITKPLYERRKGRAFIFSSIKKNPAFLQGHFDDAFAQDPTLVADLCSQQKDTGCVDDVIAKLKDDFDLKMKSAGDNTEGEGKEPGIYPAVRAARAVIALLQRLGRMDEANAFIASLKFDDVEKYPEYSFQYLEDFYTDLKNPAKVAEYKVDFERRMNARIEGEMSQDRPGFNYRHVTDEREAAEAANAGNEAAAEAKIAQLVDSIETAAELYHRISVPAARSFIVLQMERHCMMGHSPDEEPDFGYASCALYFMKKVYPVPSPPDLSNHRDYPAKKSGILFE